ncbi:MULTISPECIES: RloB family protein [Acidiphilium]|uniref:RloB family protein n=1 Tax=Acidiphilium TaxID=522 RepID=UPI001B80B99D|nr:MULTISPECIES: RloB family protein [Acidiphilium]
MIVCEGKKTEPHYLEDIRRQNSIPSAHVKVLPSALGTESRQVVDFAHRTFLETRSYERVYAVFDRDSHLTYCDALDRAAALDGKLQNDERKPVRFVAVPSVPCFELWLLLHFEDVQAFSHRTETFSRLKRHIPGYEKGSRGIFGLTEPQLDVASARAQRLRVRFDAREASDPYTAMDELVALLRNLRD